jgi:hypothetical protein
MIKHRKSRPEERFKQSELVTTNGKDDNNNNKLRTEIYVSTPAAFF